ncbi:LamG domain-containing protein, partial [Nanoarchaeota archaeon]
MKRGILVVIALICSVAVFASFSGPVEINCSDSHFNCTGLVGLWHLDNNSAYGESSTHAYDFSSNGNNCTISGAIFTQSGKLDGAYIFDGYDDQVYVSSSASLVLQDELTISVWIYPLRSSNYVVGNSWSNSNLGYYALGTFGGGIRFNWWDGATQIQYMSNNTIDLNTWTHVSVRHKFTDNSQTKMFVNGVEFPAYWQVGTGNEANTCDACRFQIGRFYGTSSGTSDMYHINGTVDEVAIWNRTLGDSEILALYNSAVLPTSSFDGTDFWSASNMSNQTGLVLSNSYGNISWNQGVDARDEDYDSSVVIGDGFVSINVSALDSSINSSANVTLFNSSCGDDIILLSGHATSKSEIINGGVPCP